MPTVYDTPVTSWTDSLHMIDPARKTKSWGAELARMLYSEFGGSRMIDYTRAMTIKSWADGKPPLDVFRSVFDPKKENENWIGTLFEPVSTIPKLLEIIRTPILNSISQVHCKAIDVTAQNQRNRDILIMKNKTKYENSLKKSSKLLGLPEDSPLKTDVQNRILSLPKVKTADVNFDSSSLDMSNTEERNIYFDMFYKQPVEIAMELSVEYLYLLNDFPEIREIMVDDSVRYGKNCVQARMNEINAIPIIEHVSPWEAIIPPSKYRDYRDNIFRGRERYCTFDEFCTLCADELDGTLIMSLFNSVAASYGYDYDWHSASASQRRELKIRYHYYEWKSINQYNYEKSKNKFDFTSVNPRDFTWNIPQEKNSNSQKLTSAGQVIYKIIYLPDAPYTFKFGLLNNMVRAKNNEYYTDFSIQPYNFSEKTLVEAVIPIDKRIGLTSLKLQHELNTSMPSGILLNLQALQNAVKMGVAGYDSVAKLVTLFVQTSKGIFAPSDATSGKNNIGNTQPFVTVEGGLAESAMRYYTAMSNDIILIRDVTGLNEARDASNPKAETLVGVQRIQYQNSMSATDFLRRGNKSTVEKLSRYLTYFVQDMCKYNKSNSYQTLLGAIGEQNLLVIQSMSNLDIRQFGISVEDTITEEQKQLVNNIVFKALENKEINPEDAIMVAFMPNYKNAVRLFTMKRNKKMKENDEREKAKMTQVENMSNAANELKMAIEKLKAQTILEKEKQHDQMMIMVENVKGQLETFLESSRQQAKTFQAEQKHNFKIIEEEHRKALEEIRKLPMAS